MAQRQKRTAKETDTLDGGRDRATLPVATPTAARRRRPTTKAAENEISSARTRAAASKHAKAATGRASKRPLDAKTGARREDKRESPKEMVTDAKPKNLKADKNDKKSKGKSTYELESRPPGKRPSRKSTRGGANHAKPDSQLRRQTTRAVRSPKNRHAMRGG